MRDSSDRELESEDLNTAAVVQSVGDDRDRKTWSRRGPQQQGRGLVLHRRFVSIEKGVFGKEMEIEQT